MAVWGKVGSICKRLRVFWEKKDAYKCDPPQWEWLPPKMYPKQGEPWTQVLAGMQDDFLAEVT